MALPIYSVEGCSFLAVAFNPDGSANGFDSSQPLFIKRVTALSLSLSSEDGTTGGTVDNENDCSDSVSNSVGELTIDAELYNKTNTGQSQLAQGSNTIIAIFKTDGQTYPDDWSSVPAETLIACGGYASVETVDYGLIVGRKEISTVNATLKFKAGKLVYGPLRDEALAITFADMYALVS